MSEHIVIVGGGIVGCMTAMELVDRGYRVTIIERNQIASQTSGESSWAGGGIIFPLLPWMYSEPVNMLTSFGASAYSRICTRLEKETGLPTGFINSGFLVLPPYDQEVATEWCQTHQQTFEWINKIDPLLAPVKGPALLLPKVCQARPPFFMKALRHWLLKHGVTLLEHTELLPLEKTDSLNVWQTTDGRTIEADKFIVTSGAWSFLLLKDVAKNLNIKPMRGQILLYQPPENLKQIVYQNGLPIIKHWSGLRPGTPENLPTISAHPSIQNLYLNTGHFRYGLTMAPASAKLIADLISKSAPFIEASHFALHAN